MIFNNGKNIIGEILVAAGILIILVMLMVPGFFMPMDLSMILLVLLVLLILIFFALVWSESSKDEREKIHKLHAGRFSFLIGSSVLVLGIMKQTFNHSIDPWLVVTLVAMILTKVIIKVYLKIKN